MDGFGFSQRSFPLSFWPLPPLARSTSASPTCGISSLLQPRSRKLSVLCFGRSACRVCCSRPWLGRPLPWPGRGCRGCSGTRWPTPRSSGLAPAPLWVRWFVSFLVGKDCSAVGSCLWPLLSAVGSRCLFWEFSTQALRPVARPNLFSPASRSTPCWGVRWDFFSFRRATMPCAP